MRGMLGYGVGALSAPLMTVSMLGPVAGLPLEVSPVQSAAIPASWDPLPAAFTCRPSSTVTLSDRSTCIGPALVNADSVSRNPSGGVTAAVGVAGRAPWAPHR